MMVDFYIWSGLAVINLIRLEGRINIRLFLMRVGLLAVYLFIFNHGRTRNHAVSRHWTASKSP